MVRILHKPGNCLGCTVKRSGLMTSRLDIELCYRSQDTPDSLRIEENITVDKCIVSRTPQSLTPKPKTICSLTIFTLAHLLPTNQTILPRQQAMHPTPLNGILLGTRCLVYLSQIDVRHIRISHHATIASKQDITVKKQRVNK